MTSTRPVSSARTGAGPRAPLAPRLPRVRRGGAGIAVAGTIALGAVTYLSFSLMPDPTTGAVTSGVSSASEAGPRVYHPWAFMMLAATYKHEADQRLVRALALAGITPETLAAAGVAAESVEGVIDDAREHLAEHGTALWAAMDAHREAVADRDTRLRKVVSGVASQNEKSAADSACSALSSACSGRDSALDGLYAAATAGLGSEQKAVLAVLRANKGRDLPVKYKTAARTDAEWTALRDALAGVRIANKTGEEVAEADTTLVSNTDAENAVSAAATGLGNNLAGVSSAWESAVAG